MTVIGCGEACFVKPKNLQKFGLVRIFFRGKFNYFNDLRFCPKNRTVLKNGQANPATSDEPTSDASMDIVRKIGEGES